MTDESASPHTDVRQGAAPLLRAALIAALAWAGWGVYRQLPEDTFGAFGQRGRNDPTALHIRIRLPAEYAPEPGERRALMLYPVNVEAARTDYAAQRRPPVRFDEYLQRRMGARAPISSEFDERGEATISVPQGRWWVHAEVDGPEALTWRLPVNVAGREKTVELNAENAYKREKSF